jgi:phage terminase large subunit GpA-like protein
MGITDSAILNTVAYHMDQDPGPIMVVQPTVDIAQAFSVDRFRPLVRDCPRIRDLVDPARAKDSTNTLLRVTFRGGFLICAGANSAASLSARPIRILLLDEIDRYPSSAGNEGDPVQLAIARTSAFPNRKIVMVSSPGTKDVSHIEREMRHSTCEHWYLPCPSCGVMQILEWDRIRFSDYAHSCISCGSHSPKYRWLAGKGEFRAHRPLDERGNKVMTRGFYVSGLFSPWVSWDILGIEFLRACRAKEAGDIEPLKAFRNTRLGALFEHEGEKVEADLYHERREEYFPGSTE